VQAKEGELLRVSLLREAGSDGNVSVFYETQQGNATADDYTAMAGEVVWLAGDASEKIIDIPIVADGAGNEFTETFFVRLYNPRNGLTLAAPNLLMVDIADKADEPVGASSSSAQSSNASSAVTNSSTANSSAPRKAMTNNSGGGAPTLLFGVGLIFLSLIKRRINVSECNGN
jgi:hypothetical protein